MKKIIFCIAVMGASLGFQSCSEDSQTKMKGDVPDSEVPEAVKVAFSTKYPGATDLQWERETENSATVYEAEFKFENMEREAFFEENGNFVREKVD